MTTLEENALMRLRLDLYAAAQVLKGEALDQFWSLIAEMVAIRPAVIEVTP